MTSRKKILLCFGCVINLCFSACSRRVDFIGHIIDEAVRGTASLHACDLDGDSDMDILGAALEDSALVWWQNEGNRPMMWTRNVIDDNVDAAISVFAQDIDGDGDLDAVAAAGTGDEIAWWRNEGGNPLAWTKHTVRTGYDFAHEVYVHDLDRDRDADILGASSYLDELTWWRNEGGDPIRWTEQRIGIDFKRAKSLRVADFDGDGDLDVAGAALTGNEVAWWRNDGGEPIRWTKCTIHGDYKGAHRVQAVDMDSDGHTDVLAAAYLGDAIDWWRNDGGTPITWTKHAIGKDFARACIAHAADLDGDGDLDVAGTAQEGNEVAWWRNTDGLGTTWEKCHIDSLKRVWPLFICDLDGDTDMDVVAASGWKGTHLVKWWENTLRK